MRWGFVPAWYKALNDGPLLINARSETVAEKPAFRAAVRARRCLIPAAGFYEWDRADPKAPLPWFVQRAPTDPPCDGGPLQDWTGAGRRGDQQLRHPDLCRQRHDGPRPRPASGGA